jgi:hypothetical protein
MRNRSKSDVIVARAKRVQKIRPVADVVKAHMHLGIDEAVTMGKRAALKISRDITVSGFDSWGKVNVDGVGARIEVYR